MRILTKKKPILIGIIAANIFLIAVALAVLFLPQETAPYTLLAEAETRIEKNLCRLAILEQDPADEVIWRQLLLEYQQHADPLTLYAAQQQAEKTLGHTIVLPEGITAVPAISAPLQEGSDIAQKGVTLKAFDQADGIASDGTVTYLSVQDGVYAHYKGLTLKYSPPRCKR
ncbi:MAG: hypothetical protein IJ333_05870 [Clostridia bacterium]|nr:hypothetical protein [Clostridia bacterium]